MATARRITIVGGGYAGALCAARLARKTSAEEAEVVLVTDRPYFVERIRLHEDTAGEPRKRRSYAELLAGTRVQVHLGRVAGADFDRRRLAFEGDDRATMAFDDLVLATGSVASRPHIPGIERAFACANEPDALALRAELDARPNARVVIVGAGLTGLELASELAERRRGLSITLVTNDDVGPMIAESGRVRVRAVLAELGIAVRERTRVAAFEDGAVLLASGESIACDVTVWAGGFVASPLARDLGLAVDDIGRAEIDGRLRSHSHPFVRVIGDAARVASIAPAGAPDVLRMACATAVPQGAFCADAIARSLHGYDEGLVNHEARAPEGRAGLFSFAYAGCCVSLGRKNGIIQLSDAWDMPTERWIGGRTAAFLKEAVCRYPLASVRLERWGFGYRWLKPPRLTPRSTHGALTSGANGPM